MAFGGRNVFLPLFKYFNFSIGMTSDQQIATFAGGCFWCMQHLFDSLPGVIRSDVGYTGGQEINPSYQSVSSGTTGHLEAIQVFFDSAKTSFEALLDIFLHHIDPTNSEGQFADIGSQYLTAVFYHDESQKLATEAYFKRLLASKQLPIIYTQILPAQQFYPAEEYHQSYFRKNKDAYMRYHHACRRDQGLKEIWKTQVD
ncbi:MAG: peptide-methionine (S)-S-oxide reductase MsrA [Parachlamydiaceae bacterium]